MLGGIDQNDVIFWIYNTYFEFIAPKYSQVCYKYKYLQFNKYTESRLTVVSREAKKKQHACASSGPRDHYSELFTRMAALKF